MTAIWRGMGVVLAAGVIAAGPVLAQEGGGGEKKRGWLRILPVGDSPPFRQKIINGVRVQLADEPGTTPPRKVLVPVSKKEKAEITLALGSISAPVVATAGPVNLLEGGAGVENPVPWAKVQMPESAAALAIMFRAGKLWDESRSLVLADHLAVFPAGSTRIVNVSTGVVTVLFAGKKHELKPGQVVVRRPADGKLDEAVLRVAIADGRGGLQRIFDSTVNQRRDERTNVVIYRADGQRPRAPVKVLVRRERPAFSPLPKKPDAES